jgi:ferrous iron transport protein A
MNEKLKAHKNYRLIRYRQECDASYRHKLLAMGFTPGAEFKTLRVAPLGDPIQIEIKGFLLSLRASEAHCLQVEELA